MDLSSHNTNPPGVFDGEAVLLSDVADTRIEESVAAIREFVAEHGSLPTVESWTGRADLMMMRRTQHPSFKSWARVGGALTSASLIARTQTQKRWHR